MVLKPFMAVIHPNRSALRHEVSLLLRFGDGRSQAVPTDRLRLRFLSGAIGLLSAAAHVTVVLTLTQYKLSNEFEGNVAGNVKLSPGDPAGGVNGGEDGRWEGSAISVRIFGRICVGNQLGGWASNLHDDTHTPIVPYASKC
ncbi:hypothetical protein BDN72DRAFT_928775 [Pluteus cervinus]|uniref:Uncharacterized protein n=1 Tax=Pluteus cervinus TaxID=181527 RepID=A0ACD3ACD8_9AGAR|nr:hypothetical protein BDN72DRAFT_928775 [Pluteus cervinus]